MCEEDFESNTQPVSIPLIARLLKRLKRRSSLPNDCDPVTLAMSSDGLAVPLTPVQRIILDLIGISRGDRDSIDIFSDEKSADMLKQLIGLGFEPQRLWLPPDAEIKSDTSGLKIKFQSPITILLCVAGRRSGKTTIASILMAWLARRILKDRSFLDGVPILPDSTVSLLNVACDTHQARILFQMLMNNLSRLDLIPDKSQPSERVKIDRLLIESLSSSSRSARGRTACGVCFDEFAHFQRTQGPFADKAVWTALTPSLATFGSRGLAVIVTSPAGRNGIVWELFRQRGERAGMLVIQVPTWVMNPNISREQLDEEFRRDENLARQEYGAEFLASHGRFLKLDDIRNCVKISMEPKPGDVRRHIHVDIGLQHDATAIAMGYIRHRGDSDFRVVIERVDVLQPIQGETLNVAEIEARIIRLATHNEVDSITFDQHQSAYLIDRLKAAGFNASVFPATVKSNRETFSFLRDLIATGKIELPDNDRLIDELAALECTPTHYGFRIEAPSGGNDDCADAVAVCAWCLSQDMGTFWEDLFDIVESG